MRKETVENSIENGMVGDQTRTHTRGASGISISNIQAQLPPETSASELAYISKTSFPAANPTPSGNSLEIQSTPCPKVLKISCLFCLNYVIQRLQPECEEDEAKERRKMQIMNLCDQLHLNKDEIPDSCLKEMFPFCEGCRGNLEKLWDLNEQLRKLQHSLTDTATEIQRKVVDKDWLERSVRKSPHPRVVAAEARKFTRLRELILEGYREATLAEFSHMNDSSRAEMFSESAVEVAIPILNPSAEQEVLHDGGSHFFDTDISDQTLMYVAPAYEVSRPGPSFASTPQTTEAPVPSPASTSNNEWTTTKRARLDDNLPSTSNNTDEEATCERGFKRKRPAVNMTPSPVLTSTDELLKNVKQESSAPAVQDEQESFEWESDDEDIFTLAVRKRRQLFEGVEILRCENPARKEYLQCSVCCFTLPVTTKYLKGNTPYQKMKAHINYIHKDQGSEMGTGRPIFECDFCALTFTTQESFQEHNATHPSHQIPAQECDICQRPIKISSNFELSFLRHKFTHKNDEERRAALDAGEKGAFYSFLAKTDVSSCYRSKKRQSVFSSKGRPGVLIVKKVQSLQNFECRKCKRTFPQKSGLAIHMRSHSRKDEANKNKGSIPSPPSSDVDVEILKVKRLMRKKVNHEIPPVLFPVSPQKKVKSTDKATQLKQKRTKVSRKNELPVENVGDPIPGTSRQLQQHEQVDDNIGMLPILKREVI